MKVIVRTFVNPLLAIAFKDGVDFVGDPDYKAMEPKQEGANKWTVLVEHDDGDDEDDDDGVVIHITAEPEPEVAPKTMKDYENKLSKTKPKTAKSAPTTERTVMEEIVHPPVKVSDSKKNLRMVPRFPTTVDGNQSSSDEPEPLPDPPRVKRDPVWPCGECIPCTQGDDCIEEIAAALKTMPGFRGER